MARGFVKENALNTAIIPTLNPSGKKCLMISTPKGKTWFYELYQLANSFEYPQYQAYTGTSYDTPYIEHEEIRRS